MKKIFETLGMNLFIVIIVSFLLDIFNILDLESILNTHYLFLIGIFFGTISYLIHFGKQHKFNIFISYLFLLVLFLLVLNYFFVIFGDYITEILILGVSFGFIVLYTNKNKIETYIESNKKSELESERNRKKEFSQKFPVFYKIPVFRTIVKWMYVEGWVYSTLLFILILFGLFLRLRYAGILSFWNDEAISVLIGQRISQGFYNTFLSGVYYPRAILYHYLLALFLPFFNNLYFYARLFNSLFFIPLSLLIYYITKRACSKVAGLLSIFFFSSLSFNIALFREARFYEFFVFSIFLISILFFIVFERLFFKNRVFDRKTIILLFLSMFVFILSFQTSYQAIYLIYPFLFYSLYLFYRTKKIKFLVLSFLETLALALGILVYFGKFKFIYLLIQPPLGWVLIPAKPSPLQFLSFLNNYIFPITLVLFFISAFFLFILKKENRLTAFLIISFISLTLITSLQAYGLSAPRYYYYTLPFLSLIFGYLFYNFFIVYGKLVRILLGLLLCFLLIFSGITESNSVINLNSVVPIKNNNINSMFEELPTTISGYTIITDSHISIPYYLYFNRTPDFILLEDYRLELNQNNNDLYLNVTPLSFTNITNNSILLIWYSESNLPEKTKLYLDNNYKNNIYWSGANRAYLISN